MVAYRLSKGVDGMGELTREHELGIQVRFLVVYIFKGKNKRQTVSHTGCEISGQISMLPEGSMGCLKSPDAYKGSSDRTTRLSTGKQSHDMKIAHICIGENGIKGG